MTIEEFVQARIAEDERIARKADSVPPGRNAFDGLDGDTFAQVSRHDPARVLRHCAALRAVLEFGAPLVSASQQIEFEETVLLPLAAIWSDHPDYRPEWAIRAEESN